ncbi:DUF2264 domain-containing protein [Salinarimonas rosea]|uniref:DUF2264 domain-containing protein n=1 Tax=Salinarimonas rosea TaxID=552063 RepID=UPI0004230F05|nr:DUF2264 domain-containing protein [Salinarimonas rosea]
MTVVDGRMRGLAGVARGAARLARGVGRRGKMGWRARRFPRRGERLLAGIARDPAPREAFDDLVRYFALGFQRHRTSGGAGADYPGFPNAYEPRNDRLEGFARIAPLLAAWCASGRPHVIPLLGGETLDARETVARGIVTGTDPTHPEYWGAFSRDKDQRMVEAADVALALWLLRAEVWDTLDRARQDTILDWFSGFARYATPESNWHLFAVLVDRVFAALGRPGLVPDARERFARIEGFHLGDGWFEDGPGGAVDYYSAWGFHYALSWIDRIDPGFAPHFIRPCQRAFLESYRYLVGPHGIPVMGRSIPYRIAAAAPLVFGQSTDPDLVGPGEARRALATTWRYFAARGALRHGVPTQGYFARDLRLLERYSGPASPLWSLRSLIAAYALPETDAFWTEPEAPLPAERGAFDIMAAAGRWRIRGEPDERRVTIEILDNPPGAAPPLEPFGPVDQIRSLAFGHPARPWNAAAKYGGRRYPSHPPFFA